MSTAYQQEKPTPFIAMSGRQLAGVISVGAVAGVLSWGIALLLDTYVLKNMLCQTLLTEQCTSSVTYSRVIGNVIATGIAVFALVKLQVFRPLLVGLCAVIGLWGVAGLLELLPWYGALALSAGLFAVAYAAFMWIARIRLFSMSLVVMIVIVALVRLTLNS
jgi:hypothetical protein